MLKILQILKNIFINDYGYNIIFLSRYNIIYMIMLNNTQNFPYFAIDLYHSLTLPTEIPNFLKIQSFQKD